jgi:hypothetical protein
MRKMSLIGLLLLLVGRSAMAQHVALDISTPMSPPTWALLERELLRANTAACEEFFAKYFDERGFLLCVERWGGDDGPDDAIENCNDWPLLHALGAPDVVLQMYKKAWEGHLRQFTLAKTTEVSFAKDGMYYKEFPVMFDWLHNGEGLTVFNLQGLSDPHDLAFQQRVRRFAGFYMNEDPGAPNYDPEHKIIRSMFNGSRGPLLRKATALDWAGDPIEIKNRFRLGHGEESYEQMLAHFKDYNDIIGDLPQNLLTTSLALNGYMMSGEEKYKAWLLEYVDAWVERMKQNGYIIPSNIGLDGKIGGATDGKWYGGCYGWAFTVVVPQDGSLAHRNTHNKGFTGFMNAYLLTGDDRYLDPWRRQIDTINAQAKVIDGRTMYPAMFGDDGWYDYSPEKYNYAALELYYLSMRADDLEEVLPQEVGGASKAGYRNNEQFSRDQRWLRYLLGQDASYPEQALRADLTRVRQRVAEMRTEDTTPDTRLADDPMHLNPASVASLIQLMLGGLHPGHQGNVLQARLRYFDPIARRAGIPEDIAALVDRLTADEVAVTLVNTNQLASREIVIQAGGYAEHQFSSVSQDSGQSQAVNSNQLAVKLAPGAGGRFVVKMKRYANQPTMTFPWDR